MKAVMLAGGMSTGRGNSLTFNLANIVLRFDDRSLPQRRIDILHRLSALTRHASPNTVIDSATGRMSNHE